VAIESFATQATVVVACLFARTEATKVAVILVAIPVVILVALLAATLWATNMLQQASKPLLLLSQRQSLRHLLLQLQRPKEKSFLKVVAARLDQRLLNRWLIQLRLSFANKGSEGVLGRGLISNRNWSHVKSNENWH